MKTRLRILLLLTPLLFTTPAAIAQKGKVREAMKKKEQTERDYKKAYEKARKKTMKHRREIQTKETQQRMDTADKRAKQYNREGDPDFFKRLFRRKKPRRK
jgi:hypothetical protein